LGADDHTNIADCSQPVDFAALAAAAIAAREGGDIAERWLTEQRANEEERRRQLAAASTHRRQGRRVASSSSRRVLARDGASSPTSSRSMASPATELAHAIAPALARTVRTPRRTQAVPVVATPTDPERIEQPGHRERERAGEERGGLIEPAQRAEDQRDAPEDHEQRENADAPRVANHPTSLAGRIDPGDSRRRRRHLEAHAAYLRSMRATGPAPRPLPWAARQRAAEILDSPERAAGFVASMPRDVQAALRRAARRSFDQRTVRRVLAFYAFLWFSSEASAKRGRAFVVHGLCREALVATFPRNRSRLGAPAFHPNTITRWGNVLIGEGLLERMQPNGAAAVHVGTTGWALAQYRLLLFRPSGHHGGLPSSSGISIWRSGSPDPVGIGGVLGSCGGAAPPDE